MSINRTRREWLKFSALSGAAAALALSSFDFPSSAEARQQFKQINQTEAGN
jgi:hypothetical protein